MYFRTLKFLILFLALSLGAWAQKITNSPYSRYGIGDINFNGTGHAVALGGTSIAESTPYFLNLVNPAANTNLQIQRFVFDVGFDVKYTNTESQSNSQKNSNSTFRYFAGGFAVKPWWTFTFAMMPYSSVGYAMSDSSNVTLENTSEVYGYSHYYSGKGGLSKISLSTSFKILKMFSIGIQGEYLFGDIERYNYIGVKATDSYYSGSYYNNNYIIHGFNYDLGFLAEKSFKYKKDSTKNCCKFAAGFYYSNKAKLNTRNELLLYTNNSLTATSDTIAADTLYDGKIEIPQSYGFGISAEFFDKFLINADYKYQNWTNFSLPGQENSTTLKENRYYGLGFQFVAAKFSSRYYRTINYRIGIHRSDTYLSINGREIQDKGFTFGLGFPVRSLLLNVSCDFGTRGTTDYNLYKEKYFLIHFNVTAHDVWFVKRKFQ